MPDAANQREPGTSRPRCSCGRPMKATVRLTYLGGKVLIAYRCQKCKRGKTWVKEAQ